MPTLASLITPPQPPDIAPDREVYGDQYDIKIDDLRRKVRLMAETLDSTACSCPVPLEGVALINIDPTIPTNPLTDPLSFLAPPAQTANGPTFLFTDNTTGIIGISTNTLPNPISVGTYTTTNPGVSAAVIELDSTGLTISTTSSAPASPFNSTQFDNVLTINDNGTITATGSQTLDFSSELTMTSTGITSWKINVPYGKYFPSGPPTVTPFFISSTNVNTGATIINPQNSMVELRFFASNPLLTSVDVSGFLLVTG